jgi:tetraacyldisaccharide 4'-kinase
MDIIIYGQWYKKLNWGWLFWPLTWIFSLIVDFRRYLFHKNILKIYKVKKPVVIVGNITVGGSGKTPVLIHLIQLLQYHGIKPGVISRGYKGKIAQSKQVASVINRPLNFEDYGDEPVLIFNNTNVPVVVGKNRVQAAQFLIDNFDIDIILSDDGLQHYSLARDIEIVVLDAERGVGNGHLLPLGPLRESVARLKDANMIINQAPNIMSTTIKLVHSIKFPERKLELESFKDLKIHAVAGIANPDKFFNQLREHGLQIIEHKFPDHHKFKASDLAFKDDYPVLMTEKDAVKCREFAAVNHWFVPLIVRLPTDTLNNFLKLVKEKIHDR